MLRFSRILLIVAAIAAFSTPAQAQRAVGVGAHAGTLGPGIEMVTNALPGLNVRLMGHYLPLSTASEIHDLDVAVAYEANLELMSIGVLADWFPFRNQVRATAGLVYNQNNVTATITPIEAYEMNGRTFAADRIGSLEATVDYKSALAPYLGVGFGNALSHRIGFALDLGVLYTNSPAVSMSGNGMIAPTAKQAPDLEEGFSTFRWWPVLNLGFNVNFARRL